MTWTWVQPKNQDELLARLVEARDLKVPERERENLCACALTEIRRLQQETLDLHAAGCAESERANAVEWKFKSRADLIAPLDAACVRYCEWYAHGHSVDAGNMAYDLVSVVRETIQMLAKEQQ
ncbi:MAG: hypothetical protein NUV51_04500 [Sulfuricaulis sp.]|nr:hypothetical protein [Sulfuricaulis sp.]